jgi:hypothetical protein
MHPGVNPHRYLIEVETARVFNLDSNSFQKTKRPRWLFSSLYWPLPDVGQVRLCAGKLFVSLPWHKTPKSALRVVGGRSGRPARFTVYATGGPVHCANEAEARGVMARLRTVVTEAVIAVSGPLCRVGMFLGVERSSVALLKAFTGPLLGSLGR